MNDTKWDELRLAMYSLAISPRWRTRDVDNGYESPWDREWFHHFRQGGYGSIEWVEIEAPTDAEVVAIRDVLVQLHVPGERTAVGFRVFGYVRPGAAVDYVKPDNGPEAVV